MIFENYNKNRKRAYKKFWFFSKYIKKKQIFSFGFTIKKQAPNFLNSFFKICAAKENTFLEYITRKQKASKSFIFLKILLEKVSTLKLLIFLSKIYILNVFWDILCKPMFLVHDIPLHKPLLCGKKGHKLH